MIFFTDELAALPTAALAGIVASAVLNLVEVGEFREFWHMRRSEFWVAAVCVIGLNKFHSCWVSLRPLNPSECK